MIKTIHKNATDRSIAAVFMCIVPCVVTDEWIWALRPKSHGHNSTPFNITRTSTRTQWHELIVNAKQVEAYDISRAIGEKLGVPYNDPCFKVEWLAGVGYAGDRNNPGSPREGIIQSRRDYDNEGGVAAR